MIHKLLPIVLLFATFCANAQTKTEGIPALRTSIENLKEAITPYTAVPAYAYPSRSGGGRRSTIYANYELGYAMFSSKNDTLKGTGGAVIFKLELGVKRLMPTRFATRFNFISFGLYYSQVNPKIAYTLNGISTKIKYNFNWVGLPLSYCSVDNEHPVGFYWQVGANINYLTEAKPETKGFPLTKFNKIGFQPYICAGVSILYDFRDMRRAAIFALYVDDQVTNMAGDPGASMHFYSFGIRYTGIAM